MMSYPFLYIFVSLLAPLSSFLILSVHGIDYIYSISMWTAHLHQPTIQASSSPIP